MMMLGYGLSVARRQKVLLVDLDAQASTSVIMMGHQRWRAAESAYLAFQLVAAVPDLGMAVADPAKVSLARSISMISASGDLEREAFDSSAATASLKTKRAILS
jgi:cellulose biosynthesis protein BcsQ